MKFLKYLILFFLAVPLLACVSSAPRRSPKTIYGQVGRILPPYSLSIAADYDSRLDGIIRGYKLLPVMIRNLSLKPMGMSASRDRWIVVGEKGQKYRAVNSLRVKDPSYWRDLPEKLRSAIDYPEVVPINYSVTFDLLLPPSATLEYFKEIRYFNAAWQQQFVIKKEY
jgi:hypothetical protein